MYIDKDLDSTKLICSFIDKLLVHKYNTDTFYCLGGYDVLFIVNALFQFNQANPCNPYGFTQS